MRKLTREQRCLILRCLIEGNGVRGTSRIAGVSKVTVSKFVADFGNFSRGMLEFFMTDLDIKRVQVDEIFSFVKTRSRNTAPERRHIEGTQWIWVAMCPDTKLVISHRVGDREVSTAKKFMKDVASRLRNRVQISSDGLRAYVDAVDESFGVDVDYGMIVKNVSKDPNDKNKEVVITEKRRIVGNPDPDHISTSYLERQNLTMRTCIKRLARKTNAHSKKLSFHEYALWIHCFYYNFGRIHQSLHVTPAMEAGITNILHDVEALVRGFEQYEDIMLYVNYSQKCHEEGIEPKTIEDYLHNLRRKRRTALIRKTSSSIWLLPLFGDLRTLFGS